MKSPAVVLITVLAMVILGSCVKNNLVIKHTITYRATSDTFHFNVSYVNENGNVVDTPVDNGWTHTIITPDGFTATLTVQSDSGHHVIANILVDDKSVADTTSTSGVVTATYKVH